MSGTTMTLQIPNRRAGTTGMVGTIQTQMYQAVGLVGSMVDGVAMSGITMTPQKRTGVWFQFEAGTRGMAGMVQTGTTGTVLLGTTGMVRTGTTCKIHRAQVAGSTGTARQVGGAMEKQPVGKTMIRKLGKMMEA